MTPPKPAIELPESAYPRPWMLALWNPRAATVRGRIRLAYALGAGTARGGPAVRVRIFNRQGELQDEEHMLPLSRAIFEFHARKARPDATAIKRALRHVAHRTTLEKPL